MSGLSENQNMLSNRAEIGNSLDDPAYANLLRYRANPFSQQNPTGVVNLSTADNNLCKDLALKKWKSIDFTKFDSEHCFRYPKAGGLDDTKEIVAKFIDRYFVGRSAIDPTKLVFFPGVKSVLDAIGCGICDPGEAILCPAPYYLRTYNNFMVRTGVRIIAVPAVEQSSCDMSVDVQRFQCVLDQAHEKGIVVKAILLTNPHNPNGGIFSVSEIKSVIDWAVKNNLFVLVNEIYAQSIYDDPENTFSSVLKYLNEIENRQKIIWMWGMSKDFCAPGFRFAVVYSEFQSLIDYFFRVELFQPTAPITQFIATQYLSDYISIDNFFEATHRELIKARNFAVKKLQDIGIETMPARAGFFVLADLRRFLSEGTFAAERQLTEKLVKVGVMMVSGEVMCADQPGWFRIVFSGSRSDFEEGLKRMEKILAK